MVRHRQFTDELAESAALYALAILPEPQCATFGQHLQEGCEVCQSEVNRCISLLAAWSQEMQITPPASMRQRLLDRIRASGYDVLTRRVSMPAWQKSWIVVRAALGAC